MKAEQQNAQEDLGVASSGSIPDTKAKPATALPWRVLGNQGTALWAGDTIVSSAVEARTHHRMARADAEYAAHAANAYPKLVAALQWNAKLWQYRDDIALLRELGELE